MSTDIQTINNTVTPAEIVMPGNAALDTLERASIDMQIATAHQFPRSLAKFKERAVSIACLDEETADSCIYRRPVGKDYETGKMKYAEGMSVRMAEIVASCYGNLRVAARIVQQDPKGRFVIAQGVAHDLETNFLSTSEVIESTVTKSGKPYDERMRIVICKAALAKARRDAIFQVVPKAMAKPVEYAVRDLLVGGSEPLVKRRERVADWVNKLGIDPNRVWQALGVGGVEDLTDNHLFTLTGLRTSIKDGEVTIDEAFPELESVSEKQSAVEKAVSKLKEKTAKTKTIEKIDPAFDAKMKEIEKWVQDGCTIKDDYISAIQMLQNFADEGKLKPEWLEDAKAVVKNVAGKNGVKI